MSMFLIRRSVPLLVPVALPSARSMPAPILAALMSTPARSMAGRNVSSSLLSPISTPAGFQFHLGVPLLVPAALPSARSMPAPILAALMSAPARSMAGRNVSSSLLSPISTPAGFQFHLGVPLLVPAVLPSARSMPSTHFCRRPSAAAAATTPAGRTPWQWCRAVRTSTVVRPEERPPSRPSPACWGVPWSPSIPRVAPRGRGRQRASTRASASDARCASERVRWTRSSVRASGCTWCSRASARGAACASSRVRWTASPWFQRAPVRPRPKRGLPGVRRSHGGGSSAGAPGNRRSTRRRIDGSRPAGSMPPNR